MSSNTLPHPGYRPDIDGLRAVAVLSVLTYHAFPNAFKGGFAGVDVLAYLSPIGALCRPDESCLARLPQPGPYNLTAVDYGHLSPEGSRWLAQTLLRPWLFALFSNQSPSR